MKKVLTGFPDPRKWVLVNYSVMAYMRRDTLIEYKVKGRFGKVLRAIANEASDIIEFEKENNITPEPTNIADEAVRDFNIINVRGRGKDAEAKEIFRHLTDHDRGLTDIDMKLSLG